MCLVTIIFFSVSYESISEMLSFLFPLPCLSPSALLYHIPLAIILNFLFDLSILLRIWMKLICCLHKIGAYTHIRFNNNSQKMSRLFMDLLTQPFTKTKNLLSSFILICNNNTCICNNIWLFSPRRECYMR